jgi:quercetin dioxygenase-like cupin family protein
VEVRPRQPGAQGPAQWFTGDVELDLIVRGAEGSELTVANVHFAPGARTAWHSHSRGQTLWVTEGEGVVQSRGEPAVAIGPGNVVDTPADEWHWHGAGPDRPMTHLSITEGGAEWGEHVTDEEYRRG